MNIVVIGGSGRVGENVVRRLGAQGHDPVPASPATGVDTITGAGLADVMEGADVVVDVSNAPVWDDDAVREFFTTSTRNLLAAERDARVGHHLAVSIVGADRLPDSGYLRAKVAQEAAIAAGAVPYTILRATQFFEFLSQIAEAGAAGGNGRPAPPRMHPLAPADDPPPPAAAGARGPPGGCRPGSCSSSPSTTSPRPWPSWRPALRWAAVSSWAAPRRWASTPGRGACSPPPGTGGRSSPTRTRATSARSCRATS